MKNSNNNIDNLLKDRLKDFSSSPSENVRASLALKVKKFNFLIFNPTSFNIFYFLAIILGISAILVFKFGLFEKDKEISQIKTEIIETKQIQESKTEKVIEINDVSKNIETNNIENVEIESDFNTENNSNEFNKPVLDETNNINNTKTDIFDNKNEPLIEDSKEYNDPKQIDTVDALDKKSIEKTIIYDTVTNVVNVNVVDTVKIELGKTIKVKRPRRKRK